MGLPVDNLLNDVALLITDEADKFQEFFYEDVEGASKKGSPEGAILIDGIWIPKSQLRLFEDRLYISKWLYTKIR